MARCTGRCGRSTPPPIPTYQGEGSSAGSRSRPSTTSRPRASSFVFNTPNAAEPTGLPQDGLDAGGSPPGLGEADVAGVAVSDAPIAGPGRTLVDAQPTPAARPREVLADPSLGELLQRHRRRRPASTLAVTPAYLRWRYGFEPLAYRAVTVSDRVADGRRRLPVATPRRGDRVRPVRGARAGRGTRRPPDVCCGPSRPTSGADYVIRIGGPLVDLGPGSSACPVRPDPHLAAARRRPRPAAALDDWRPEPGRRRAVLIGSSGRRWHTRPMASGATSGEPTGA